MKVLNLASIAILIGLLSSCAEQSISADGLSSGDSTELANILRDEKSKDSNDEAIPYEPPAEYMGMTAEKAANLTEEEIVALTNSRLVTWTFYRCPEQIKITSRDLYTSTSYQVGGWEGKIIYDAILPVGSGDLVTYQGILYTRCHALNEWSESNQYSPLVKYILGDFIVEEIRDISILRIVGDASENPVCFLAGSKPGFLGFGLMQGFVCATQ